MIRREWRKETKDQFTGDWRWPKLHAEATIVDLHVHPGLKATWLQRQLWRLNATHASLRLALKGLLDRDWMSLFLYLLQKVVRLDPMGRDPFAVRTDFQKMYQGRVDLVLSAAYALEREWLEDFVVRLKLLGVLKVPFRSVARVIRSPLTVLVPVVLTPVLIAVLVILKFLWDIAAMLVTGHLSGILLADALLSELAVVASWAWQSIFWLLPLVAILLLVGFLADRLVKGFRSQIKKKVNYFAATCITFDTVEAEAHKSNKASDGVNVEVVKRVERLEELLEWKEDQPIIILHSIEGAHCLEGPETSKVFQNTKALKKNGIHSKLDVDKLLNSDHYEDYQAIENEVIGNLETYADKYGVAAIALGHYYPNVVAPSAFPYPDRPLEGVDPERWNYIWKDPTCGLTELGKKVVARMFELGVLVDLRHVAPKARIDVYKLAEDMGKHGGVMASHMGLSGMYHHHYNLDDWEIKWLADNGGIIGIHFTTFVLSGVDDAKLGMGYIVRMIDHIKQQTGKVDCIAIGSDLDGMSNPLDEIPDLSKMHRFTQYLAAQAKYGTWGGPPYPKGVGPKSSDDEIKQILGNNAKKFLIDNWQKGLQTTQPTRTKSRKKKKRAST